MCVCVWICVDMCVYTHVRVYVCAQHIQIILMKEKYSIVMLCLKSKINRYNFSTHLGTKVINVTYRSL